MGHSTSAVKEVALAILSDTMNSPASHIVPEKWKRLEYFASVVRTIFEL